MKLTDRMRELRKTNNYSQEDIAKKLDISTSAYGFYEQGKTTPNAKTLEYLADLYNVTVDYLLGRTSNPRLNARDEVDIACNIRDMRQQMDSGVLRMSLDGEEVSDEVKEFILDQMENALIIAKIKAKEKFTPKKFR